MEDIKGIFYFQSHYSIMESIPSIEDLVIKAKKNNYDFVALSDNQNLYGMLEFIFLCQKNKIKPILGMQVFLSLKNIISPDKKISFCVYALNDLGINNLIKISNLAKTQKRDILLEELCDLKEGLFFVLSNIDFLFCDLFKKEWVEVIFEKLKKTFHLFFFGLSLQSEYLEMFANTYCFDIIKKLKILIVKVHQTSFLEPSQKKAHQLLLKLFHSEKAKKYNEMFFLFLDLKEIENKYNSHYKNYSHLFLNLKEFIPQIEYKQIFPSDLKLPVYKQSLEKTSFDYLKKISLDALKEKVLDSSPEFTFYLKRLNKELKIIKDMNFEDYFLIVHDLVNFSKNKNILVGPGRGSAAGSLVCFCLGITESDPLKYDLLFERFLNPKRNKKPDIDLDFPDDKLSIVLEYIYQKYGENYTANINTFSTLSAKTFAKNTNYIDYQKSYPNTTIKNNELNLIINELEGMPQFTRNHPSGVVISNKDLFQFIPLQTNENSNHPFKYQTQLESKYLEKIGLIKIDLLSLKSLSFVAKILEEINKNREIKLNWFQISLDDFNSYQLLKKADTEYIFQLESDMAKTILQKTDPKHFEDLVAVLALNRPGQIHYISDYCRNKKQKKNYLIEPDLELCIGHILRNTQGLILYQEQIMEIVVHVAGYDLGESEIFMKYILNKDKNNISEDFMKKNFLIRANRNGHSKEMALKIYNYILKFSNYSFNKSHSVSYSLISYRMAFLKANYFLPFMKVILDGCQKNTSETSKILRKIKEKNIIKILYPNIFTSSLRYQLSKTKILLPLTSIINVSESIAFFIIKEREKKIFLDFYDFKKRCFPVLNNNLLKDLVLAGVFEDFHLNKNTLLNECHLETLEHEQYLQPFKKKVLLEELPDSILKQEVIRVFGFDLNSLSV
ncbi:DNA polymerase III subunit alpha [Candidatus Phytoplasma luffae]|uniref:DNA-directed DNA polymerase n=1 Tax=Loofah witches'-broom phytoplasma TaxID=35773 RepID=A0A975FJF8_LOWBP|nr:PHP domain-containing protein [Candidatus Phytoplasma luffae]QTX03089.1 DNA polymerase III subunit alpha [Candidatus Phytoplasma luffae]